jgi:hypothetical protein
LGVNKMMIKRDHAPSISSSTSIASYSISEQRTFTPDRQITQRGYSDENNSDSTSVAAVMDIDSVHSFPKQQDLFDQVPTSKNTNNIIQVNEFTPKPATYQQAPGQMMSAYYPAPTPTTPVLKDEPHAYFQPPQSGQSGQIVLPFQHQNQFGEQYAYQHSPTQVSPGPTSFASHEITPIQEQSIEPYPHSTLTMEPLSIPQLEARDAPPMSNLDQAFHSLVNMNDLSETLETPEQRKTQEKKAAGQPFESKPLPPTKPEWSLGLEPSLGDIQARANPKTTPSKEIMRPSAFDPAGGQAGMVVPYGSAAPQHQGYGNQSPHSTFEFQQQSAFIA